MRKAPTEILSELEARRSAVRVRLKTALGVLIIEVRPDTGSPSARLV
jgi:hypothetical protein